MIRRESDDMDTSRKSVQLARVLRVTAHLGRVIVHSGKLVARAVSGDPPVTRQRHRPMTTHSRYFAVAIAVVAVACGKSEEQPASEAAAPAGPQQVGEASGMKTPESARYDAAQDLWFVSNINGNPSQKDGNGFIVRLTAEGAAMDSTPFIQSGKNEVALNAPKGMALVGDTLWVADIDAVRAFNARTGAPIASLEIKGAAFLNDVVAGPDGSIYITDTGVRFDDKGQMTHPGPTASCRSLAASISGWSPLLASRDQRHRMMRVDSGFSSMRSRARLSSSGSPGWPPQTPSALAPVPVMALSSSRTVVRSTPAGPTRR